MFYIIIILFFYSKLILILKKKKRWCSFVIIKSLEFSKKIVDFFKTVSKQFYKKKPRLQIIYLNDSDLKQSIVELGRFGDITQLSLKDSKIVYGVMRSPGLKKIIYNLKFPFYLYRRFSETIFKKKPNKNSKTELVNKEKDYTLEYTELLKYVKANYDTDEVLLVLKPDTKKEVIDLLKKFNFKTLLLNNKGDNNWSFEYDHHWTCYGHERAAEQVANYLKNLKIN